MIICLDYSCAATIKIFLSNSDDYVQMFKSGVKHDHEKKKRNANLTPQVKNEIFELVKQELEPARILNLLRVTKI